MEAYLRAFVNWEQKYWAKLLLIAEFIYNNTKNANTGYILFKFTYGYHIKVLFEEDVNSYSRSCSTNKLAKEIRELIKVCCQNLLHAQELQKKAYDQRVKSCSYTLGKKVWLNS